MDATTSTSRKLSRDSERGGTMLEYTILIAFIALATMLALRPVGETIKDYWQSAADSFAEELPF